MPAVVPSAGAGMPPQVIPPVPPASGSLPVRDNNVLPQPRAEPRVPAVVSRAPSSTSSGVSAPRSAPSPAPLSSSIGGGERDGAPAIRRRRPGGDPEAAAGLNVSGSTGGNGSSSSSSSRGGGGGAPAAAARAAPSSNQQAGPARGGGRRRQREAAEGEGQRQEPRDQDEEDRHACSLCWDLLVRPCTLPCGFTLCQLCLARLLEQAQGQNGAVCPVLGPDCPSGRVRELPAVNVLLHDELQQRYGQRYTERLAEADREENKRIVDAVKARQAGRGQARAGGAGPGGGAAAMGGVVAGGGEQRALLAWRVGIIPGFSLRRIVPLYLLAALLCYLVPPTSDRRFRPLQSSVVAWHLATNWTIAWMYAGTLATCSSRAYGVLHTAIGSKARQDLLRLRSWHQQIPFRLQILSDFDPYYRFAGTCMLVASILHLVLFYVAVARARIAAMRARHRPLASIIKHELLVFILVIVIQECLNLVYDWLYMLSPQRCLLVYRLPILAQLAWSVQNAIKEISTVLLLIGGVDRPPHDWLVFAEHFLPVLQDGPWWFEVLFDPRLTWPVILQSPEVDAACVFWRYLPPALDAARARNVEVGVGIVVRVINELQHLLF